MHAHYWGIIYYTLNVGITRIVSVFLSWLNTKLAAESFGTSLAIFYAVGLTMFLLPPVPGVPVYITGGILLVNSCLNDGWEFGTAIVFTSFICFMIKLNAIAMQQKLFGECMGSKSVKVRAAVGVNSTTIKAIRMILLKPGIHIAKVAILCGGPDWPTSVLTGILRLRLSQMLLGSLPVLFLISPCVLAGAFAAGPLLSRLPDNLPTAAYFARKLVEAHAQLDLPPRTVLNVNVPNLPLEHIRGVQLTRLGHRARAPAPVKAVNPRGKEGYWIAAAGDVEDGSPGTDFHAVMQGYVSVTPLRLDRTFNEALESMDGWLEGIF